MRYVYDKNYHNEYTVPNALKETVIARAETSSRKSNSLPCPVIRLVLKTVK